MLNRRILRIKLFKTLYAYTQNHSMTLKEAEGLFDASIESSKDLYLFLLGSIVPLTRTSERRIEALRSKFHPTEEQRNPNLKFTLNKIAATLDSDPDLTKILDRKHLKWEDQYDAFLKHVNDSLQDKDFFRKYMESSENSISQDAALWCEIFRNIYLDNAELAEILEDISIHWNDDVPVAVSQICLTLKDLGEGKPWSIPEIDDKAFGVGVLRKAFVNFNKYFESIASLTPKWDKNRLCSTDIALIIAGIAESEAIPETDRKIIINEYVEISKYYSTPDSRAFVNGLLDKLIVK